ncbi:hypothetical protein ABMA84_15825 [Halobacteriovorax sp. XZX-2]|uniref:hypothetical protein n=1 Tax=unclassified Halobacteriovorax TaxID=2639665 RepID=UPI003710C7C9
MASINNTGGLWKNKQRNHPKSPDFTGQVTIEGVTYYISGWKTDGKQGKPVVSIKVNQKKLEDPITQPKQKQYTEPPKDFDDDIPF